MPRSAAKSESVRLQDRDLEILRGLFECRVMTAAHVAAIYFGDKAEAAKKRLQKLKAEGLIGTKRRSPTDPAILSLTRAGLLLLREHGILAKYPAAFLPALERRAALSESTTRHELAVMDFKSALHRALGGHARFSLEEAITWPALNQFDSFDPDGGEITIKPDGSIRIHEREADGGLSEHSFFLEIDRGTETLDTLVRKTVGYLGHYRSGGFALKNGGTRDAYKEYPFRVLMVFRTAERRNNMAERLIQATPPILTQVLLSTMDEANERPLDSIWIRPLDYRAGTAETAYAPHESISRYEYKRQTARDSFVVERVPKVPLLAETQRK